MSKLLRWNEKFYVVYDFVNFLPVGLIKATLSYLILAYEKTLIVIIKAIIIILN